MSGQGLIKLAYRAMFKAVFEAMAELLRNRQVDAGVIRRFENYTLRRFVSELELFYQV